MSEAGLSGPLTRTGERPSLKDWETHLTTIFPEVRLKRYMEMRGADGGPAITALTALWVGLLYDRRVISRPGSCLFRQLAFRHPPFPAPTRAAKSFSARQPNIEAVTSWQGHVR